MIKINKYLVLIILSVLLFIFNGCGEDKTIYETSSDNSISTSTTSSTTITSTNSTTTTTNSTPASAGETLFIQNCQNCHTAKSVAGTTVAAIKSASMTKGLTDAQLQTMVDYLATL